MRLKYFLSFLLLIFYYQNIFTQTPFNNTQTTIGTTTEISGGLIVKGESQLFLQSPGGLCWAITVDDHGVLSTEQVYCDSYTKFEVTLSDTQTYEYSIAIGDEEGASIYQQANHFSTSEIVNGASTNWIPTYIYRSQGGYTGTDKVILAIETGSDGASPNSHIEYVTINFVIHD